jgi:2-succinyl-5-enolpyruvyl-6-hydroxy-3-cyclohexene-1-carboxylate synthase
VPPVGGRGLVVVGGAQELQLDSVVAGIPLLVEPRSGVSGGRAAITHVDALLRVPELRDELRPDVAVRLDRLPASRLLAEWLADVPEVGDPDEPVPEGWLERWRQLDDAADAAIAAVLADHPEPTEPGTARALLGTLRGAALVVASSMPIRDLEWYGGPSGSVQVLANRGANGIDGTISTAIGIARATGRPTVCLLGDVAFLHDSNALIGIGARGVDLTIVVIDNDGGGIFSFLPQATALPADRFELLFGTPHGVRPEALAAAHGLVSITVDAAEALAPAVDASLATGGVRLVVVRTDRSANVRLHDELHAAVADAVRAL